MATDAAVKFHTSSTSPQPILHTGHHRLPSTHQFSTSFTARSFSAAMSWTDTFDFPSRSPLNSSLHFPCGTSPLSCSPGFSFGSVSDRLPLFEREFLCNGFTCCGQTLSDMHELLSHFEEVHVKIVGSDGRPLSSVNSSPGSSIESHSGPVTPNLDGDGHPHMYHLAGKKASFASNVFGFPQVPASPPQSLPLLSTSAANTRRTTQQPVNVLTNAPTYPSQIAVTTLTPSTTVPTPPSVPTSRKDEEDDIMMDFDPLDDASSSTSSQGSSVAAGEHMCLPPALLTAPAPSRKIPDVAVRLPSPLGSEGRKGSTGSVGAGAKSKSDARVDGATAANKKQREKLYKCSVPGCTKSYLNPNGLKYHRSKGTCNISIDHDSMQL